MRRVLFSSPVVSVARTTLFAEPNFVLLSSFFFNYFQQRPEVEQVKGILAYRNGRTGSRSKFNSGGDIIIEDPIEETEVERVEEGMG